jgi:hypothetical protein
MMREALIQYRSEGRQLGPPKSRINSFGFIIRLSFRVVWLSAPPMCIAISYRGGVIGAEPYTNLEIQPHRNCIRKSSLRAQTRGTLPSRAAAFKSEVHFKLVKDQLWRTTGSNAEGKDSFHSE